MIKILHKKYPITLDEFNRRYWKLGQSMERIARDLNGHGGELRRHALKAGLRIKTKNQAYGDRTRENINRVHSVNQRFFKTLTPAMSWIVGLIASDGCIQKHGRDWQITLADLDCLQQVAEHVQYTGPIRATQSKCFVLKVNSVFMVRDLIRIGMTPRKSLTLTYPEIPTNLQRHFVRGYFDGDGNFNVQQGRSKSNYLQYGRATFSTGSEQFADSLMSVFQSLDMRSHKRSQDIKTRRFPGREKTSDLAPIYAVRVNGESAVKLFHYMYDDTPQNISMKRKRKKYTDWYKTSGYKYEADEVTYRHLPDQLAQKCSLCDRQARARGLCSAHYTALLRSNGGKAPKR